MNRAVEFVTVVGYQDKKRTPPPVRNTPTVPPKQVKPKTQFLPPSTPSGSKKQEMASKITSTQSNTDEFSVVEQNSERVNINDIARIPEIAAAVLLVSKGDGLKTVLCVSREEILRSDFQVKSLWKEIYQGNRYGH